MWQLYHYGTSHEWFTWSFNIQGVVFLFFYWSNIHRSYLCTIEVIDLFWFCCFQVISKNILYIQYTVIYVRERFKDVECHDKSSWTQLLNDIWTKIASLNNHLRTLIKTKTVDIIEQQHFFLVYPDCHRAIEFRHQREKTYTWSPYCSEKYSRAKFSPGINNHVKRHRR